jgi:hypothetical protein
MHTVPLIKRKIAPSVAAGDLGPQDGFLGVCP